jgi:peptide alpha-N-acetyltransferase
LCARTAALVFTNRPFQVVLETEITNKGAVKLYQSLGFVQDKYLNRYYLNGSDAIRLKLYLG